MPQETRADQILQVLHDGGVRLILVGGLAAVVHGSGRATLAVDVVYARDPENIRRLARALQPHSPYLRGAPPGLPFCWDEETIRNGLNFTLTTSMGDLDLLGGITGGGGYGQLLPSTQEVDVFGRTIRCVTLERLVQLKRAAGRPRDLEVIAELQALLEEREQRNPHR